MQIQSDIDRIVELLQITRTDAVKVKAQMKADAFSFERYTKASFAKAANKALTAINQR